MYEFLFCTQHSLCCRAIQKRTAPVGLPPTQKAAIASESGLSDARRSATTSRRLVLRATSWSASSQQCIRWRFLISHRHARCTHCSRRLKLRLQLWNVAQPKHVVQQSSACRRAPACDSTRSRCPTMRPRCSTATRCRLRAPQRASVRSPSCVCMDFEGISLSVHLERAIHDEV